MLLHHPVQYAALITSYKLIRLNVPIAFNSATVFDVADWEPDAEYGERQTLFKMFLNNPVQRFDDSSHLIFGNSDSKCQSMSMLACGTPRIFTISPSIR
ncbi:hypothetical protein SAMN05421863_100436 [Nitrosomonas communis]|uniref:Uncharacterized protein n=1 Tax=Nitrosomonas communis TaxID=44574 RepID=A0A1I4KFI9_9PROT|nr:hypothetical protein SAMN05421863_100436 [Nitrosomonas communis]